MFNLFKRKKSAPPFDYGASLMRLAAVCRKCERYSLVFPSVYYHAQKEVYVVHFQCVQREFLPDSRKHKYYYSLRRDEKLCGPNLERLMDFAVAYADCSCAFTHPTQDNLLEGGISVRIRNFTRTLNTRPTSWKI